MPREPVMPTPPGGLFERRNYLLRVVEGPAGWCYLVQDLRTGERVALTTEEEVRRFLTIREEPRRLR
jgi:hypothetical protein